MVFVRRGSGQMVFDEPSERVRVRAGQVVLVAPHVGVGLTPDGLVEATTVFVSTRYLVDQIGLHYPQLAFDQTSTHRVAECWLRRRFRVLTLPPGELTQVVSHLDVLAGLTTDGEVAAQFGLAQSAAMGIWLQVRPLLAEQRGGTSAGCGHRLRRQRMGCGQSVVMTGPVREALGWMRLNYHQAWTLSELARQVGMGQRGLVKAFHAQTGQTPHGWRDGMRVSEMTRLLASTSMSVPQVAKQVGWACPNHASDQFKAAQGVTPAQWRSQVEQVAA